MEEIGEKLEKVLNRIVSEMQQDGVDLQYSVNLYASRRGVNATIQLQIREKQDDRQQAEP